MERTVHCPKCDSMDIREVNEQIVDLALYDFEFDEGGYVVGYQTGDEVSSGDLETVTVNPMRCGNCQWQGSMEALRVMPDDARDFVLKDDEPRRLLFPE